VARFEERTGSANQVFPEAGGHVAKGEVGTYDAQCLSLGRCSTPFLELSGAHYRFSRSRLRFTILKTFVFRDVKETLTTSSVPSDLTSALGNPLTSDWMRTKPFKELYGIGNSFLYSLIQQGILRSVSLKKRGNIRGIRLISRSSFEEYLSQLADSQKEVR
jgi:hypothetical protein